MNLPRPYPSARQRASGTDGARSVSRLPLGLHEMQWRKTRHAAGLSKLAEAMCYLRPNHRGHLNNGLDHKFGLIKMDPVSALVSDDVPAVE